MLIGDRIKQLRLDAKMTQPELAARLDVTRSAVAAYENNTRQPSFQVLIKLVEIFHVTTDYLILGSGDDTLDVNGLSGEQKLILISLIKNFQETNEKLQFTTRTKKNLALRNNDLRKKLKEIEETKQKKFYF